MVIVRPISTADAASIWTIFADQQGFSTGTRIKFYDEEEIEFWAEDPQSIFLVAKDNGRYVGFIFAKIISPSWAMIDGFFVLPSARGTGAGKQLLQELEDRVQKRGIEYVHAMMCGQDTIDWAVSQDFERGNVYAWMEKWLPTKHVYKKGTRLGFTPEVAGPLYG